MVNHVTLNDYEQNVVIRALDEKSQGKEEMKLEAKELLVKVGNAPEKKKRRGRDEAR